MRWLSREMQWKAQDYLLTVEQETLGFISLAEEAQLLHSLRGFSTRRLQDHLRRRLSVEPPRTTDGRAGAELAARHPPTVWAAFQLAVQTRLQERSMATIKLKSITTERATLEREGEGALLSVIDGDLDGAMEASDVRRERANDVTWQQDLEWTLLQQIREPERR